jgi:hypothetical protein
MPLTPSLMPPAARRQPAGMLRVDSAAAAPLRQYV